jgi:hypothetical protein
MKRLAFYLACAWALWASGDYTGVVRKGTRGMRVTAQPHILDYFENRGHCMMAWQRRIEREDKDRDVARAQGVAVQGEMHYRCLPQGVQPTTWD